MTWYIFNDTQVFKGPNLVSTKFCVITKRRFGSQFRHLPKHELSQAN